MDINQNNDINDIDDLLELFYRYLSFWPYYLISIVICLTSIFIFLRYEDNLYLTTAKIEIIDDAMNSEMALPTEITIFNRSTINLENEIEIVKSYRIISQVVKSLNLNVRFHTIGRIKSTENDKSQWLNGLNYEISYKYNLKNTNRYQNYFFSFENNKIIVTSELGDNERKFIFNDKWISHEKLPFTIKINDNVQKLSGMNFKLEIIPFENAVKQLISTIVVEGIGKQSDILVLKLAYNNKLLAKRILDELINKFDEDGIKDRQLVFRRTIDFVDSRFEVLKAELDTIEENKKSFKEENKLIDIEFNATSSNEQKIEYDNQLFQSSAELEIVNFLIDDISDNLADLLPTNLAINNQGLSLLISQYNNIVIDRSKYLNDAGKNNIVIKNIDQQIADLSENIKNSLFSIKKSLEIQISNLSKKEFQFKDNYSQIPKNEKILRSIEREQQIKEALFLLLLQKREEAAINFAVTKPSIKIIDNAMNSLGPISPNVKLLYVGSILFAFLFPTLILFILFLLDNKIHTRKDLVKKLDDIAILGEIPHIDDNNLLNRISNSEDRDVLSESIRMITAGFNFLLHDNKKNKKNVILITSTIKGEGKTIIAVNTAANMSNKFKKVLLIGADLRNPQIHKFLGIAKDKADGLSDYIYKDSPWEDYIIKKDNLDILLSGSIPPNPGQLLSSEKFKIFIETVKNKYDYIIIDSAPCLLVSDTFEISKYVNTTMYVVRSNFTQNHLFNFINEIKNEEKLPNINIIFNSVGNSERYGYKYGYQYGYRYVYKYGYNYGYNYGYGYGYGEDEV